MKHKIISLLLAASMAMLCAGCSVSLPFLQQNEQTSEPETAISEEVTAEETTVEESTTEEETTVDYGYGFELGDEYKGGVIYTMDENGYTVYYESLQYISFSGKAYENLQCYDFYGPDGKFVNRTFTDGENGTVASAYALNRPDGTVYLEYSEADGTTYRVVQDAEGNIIKTMSASEVASEKTSIAASQTASEAVSSSVAASQAVSQSAVSPTVVSTTVQK